MTLVYMSAGGPGMAPFRVTESPRKIQALLVIAGANRYPAIKLTFVSGDTKQPVVVSVRHFLGATAEVV